MVLSVNHMVKRSTVMYVAVSEMNRIEFFKKNNRGKPPPEPSSFKRYPKLIVKGKTGCYDCIQFKNRGIKSHCLKRSTLDLRIFPTQRILACLELKGNK